MSGQDKLTLYGTHLSLPSCRVALMLSLCGAKYDYFHIDLMAGAQKLPTFLAKNRFGQVPVLDHNGRFVCQSAVILSYLADLFGKFQGQTAEEKLHINEWLFWDQDRLANSVGTTRVLTRFFPVDPAVVVWAKARGEQGLDQLESHLKSNEYLVGGRPTIADVASYVWVATCEEGGFSLDGRPHVLAWANKIKALPGGGHPYDVIPKEDKAA